MKGQWTKVYSGDLPLRSWWVDSGGDCKYISIILPEVFGINHWIRSFSEIKIDKTFIKKTFIKH